ncbi:MAG TPA: SIMPL domain-containing protein [Ramlibacter sp.]|nr:SIMPL domain-containing protein [Ramlibacter sp.]
MGTAFAQAAAPAPAPAPQAATQPGAPQNVLQLSASSFVETPQDLLVMSLSAVREGADAAAVQAQARSALEPALEQARRAAMPGQLDVRTGGFSLYPRHGRDGKIAAWVASAELILEGRDFARITQTAARISTMNIASVGFSLSREQRAAAQAQAQSQAIEQFQARATALARGFGFGAWSLREVGVDSGEQQPPRPRVMAMDARVATEAALPVEAGKATVTVTVSGSVQLR